MPSPIRNSSVARGTLAATAVTSIYQVPAGYVLLLKSLYLRPNALATWNALAYARQQTLGAIVTIFDTGSITTGHANWEGWVVLNATDEIQIAVGPVGIDYWASGALLPFTERLPS